jgi:hypothetical protein
MGFEYTYVCYCEYTRRMWVEWLRRKYSDIGSANRIWGTRFADFTAVPMQHSEGAAANRALWFDWSSFNLYRFLEQIRWTRNQIRRWKPNEPLTVGSPYYAFSPAFWTGVDEEELADSGITSVVLEENYALDTLMPEYLHALANGKPVADFEYHGIIQQILPSFLHGDAAISMWWWNDEKHWTPNEPINEWTTSFPQSYTIPLSDIAKAMRDALDLRRLSREIATLGSAPRPIALLYSKTSMLQQVPDHSRETDSNPHLSALRQIYNDSQSAGLYVGITTEKKVLAGDLETRKILVLPSVEFLPEPVTHKILRWAERGGTLVVSPDSLVGDEYARPSQAARLLHSRAIREGPAHPKRGESWGRFLSVVAENARLKPEHIVTRQDSGTAPEVEYRVTSFDGGRLAYFVNNSDQDVRIALQPAFSFTRIVDRRTETALPEPKLLLPARETAIVQFQ